MPPRRPTRESDLYPRVEAWLRRRGCFATAINTGLRFGRIDVVGLRDVGGDLSARCEVIAVEVKGGNQPFATSAGQSHGYSVYAQRCYLADRRERRPAFNDDEIEIASRLGIGLVAITQTRVTEVLAAPTNEPVERFQLQVLDRLAWCRCTICTTMFQRGARESDWSLVSRSSSRGGVLRAAKAERGFVYWLDDSSRRAKRVDAKGRIYHRRYVCPDCVENLWGDFADAQ